MVINKLVLCSGYNTYSLSKSAKGVFIEQDTWYSPNTLLIMIHDQALSIIT